MRNRLRSGWSFAGAAGFLVVVATACSTASEEAASKRAPKTPPPQGLVKVPDTWRAEVQLDGVSVAALTAAEMNSIKPDFSDSERRGWKVETLLPGAANATVVIADGAPGVSVMYEVPKPGTEGSGAGAAGGAASAALRPAIFVTRRGEVSVAAVDVENPFPRYHGKGGQLRRIGDSQPRLLGVTRLRIFHGRATL
jgi:hypothetical protein